MSITAMRQALNALEMLARYENPETRIQVRKPKDGGPIVTMYPHKVATDAADVLRTAIAEVEKPVAWEQFYPDMGKPVQWVGLTDEQINQYDYQYRDILYDVEKMLRENNA